MTGSMSVGAVMARITAIQSALALPGSTGAAPVAGATDAGSRMIALAQGELAAGRRRAPTTRGASRNTGARAR